MIQIIWNSIHDQTTVTPESFKIASKSEKFQYLRFNGYSRQNLSCR